MLADRLVASTLAFLLLLAPAAALAEAPSTAVTSGNRELALEKARQGLELYRAEQWQEAAERFREADQLHHAPTLVLYLARCQRKLGKLAEAQALYEQILAEPLPQDAPAPFHQAHRDAAIELDEVRAQLAPPPPAAPPAPVAPSPAEHKGSLLPGAIVLGLGAAGVGVGAVTGLLSLSRVSDLRARCPDNRCPPDARGDADTATALGTVSTVAFIGGGAALAAGAILLVIRPGGGEAPAVGAAPAPRWSAGVGLDGIELRVTF